MIQPASLSNLAETRTEKRKKQEAKQREHLTEQKLDRQL
jgi:hypothetical protein